jgi:hypothetical protein
VGAANHACARHRLHGRHDDLADVLDEALSENAPGLLTMGSRFGRGY